MPELIQFSTEHFELTVWCVDIIQRQKVFQATAEKRKLISGNADAVAQQPLIRISPSLKIQQLSVLGVPNKEFGNDPINKLLPPQWLFFENTQYHFEWELSLDVDSARLCHRSQRVNDSFRFSKKRGDRPARLTGTINTGNDVGWMCLPFEYEIGGERVRSDIAFEVLPTKMNLHQDLPSMYQDIDKIFPLWRFSLVEKTEQDADRSKQRGHFPLMWLANFGHLRQRFEKGLKIITQAPHSQLQAHVTHNKASRLKGKIPYKLSMKIKEDIANGQTDKRYRVEKKKLSVDTPENQFIKMVVKHSKQRLEEFEQKLRISNQVPDKQRLSESFLDELHLWQQPMRKMLNQSFIKDVGGYSGRNSESLVLQQKTGYSAVYRVWQELKFYLDVFANQTSISMKSVAEIYEVWCFLAIKNILQNQLGFEELPNKKVILELNEFSEFQLKDGFAGAFSFKRSDGVVARLAHEPRFGKQGNPIRSYVVSQEPDIVLEVTFPSPSKKRYIWLFDAKYRIKSEQNRYDEENIDAMDYVPDDAINQMHRYRDALIRITDGSQKSRPVFGAFALYPGYFDQTTELNPYADAIANIGIGAFALLPTVKSNNEESNEGQVWLSQFLKEQIGPQTEGTVVYQPSQTEEHLYLQDAARIPYSGMSQVLYPNLIMTVAVGGKINRESSYLAAFENGTANWYHTKESTFNDKFKEHVIREIRYLALATTSKQNPSTKQIDKLWPVVSVANVPRARITVEQAGKASDSIEPYYLFELGKPLTLKDAVVGVPHQPIKNTMKLTDLSQMEKAQVFADLETVYQDALV